jgi:sulfate transport system ATP-binding protein
MSIEISGINKKFGDFVALEDVSLSIPTGQLTALLGPSGGGKSTLLRIIAGLESADEGSVHIEGAEATHLPPQKRNVGFVFQHYAAFKHMSVARNVAFGLEIRKRSKAETKRRVEELLELVHLSQFAHRLPSQLSGGQRQRMALARALAVEPTVLLLDEPFGALDAKVRKELRDWLRRLHDEVHVTTVFVTHDQEEALEVADEIVVINDGRIEQVGSPDQLYDEPANDFVMSFLGPVTRLRGALIRPHDIDVLTSGAAVSAAGSPAVAGEVTRMLRVGFEVRLTVRPGSPSAAHAPAAAAAVSSSAASTSAAVTAVVDVAAPGEEDDVTVVLTRSHARELDLDVGSRVWLAPNRGATTMPVARAV